MKQLLDSSHSLVEVNQNLLVFMLSSSLRLIMFRAFPTMFSHTAPFSSCNSSWVSVAVALSNLTQHEAVQLRLARGCAGQSISHLFYQVWISR